MNKIPLNKTALSDWLAHIESFHPDEIELGLSRIKQVAVKLEVLTFSGKIILVGGTNGKGSCVATLESIALHNNQSVVCYTSPHLLSFNERIRFNGKNVSDQDLIQSFEKIEKVRGDTTLTFFEFTTLAALLLAKNWQPDLLVLEVGLGGRLDATNILDNDAAIITTIDKDHCDWLGDTFESIAYEKGGIVRKNKPVFVGDSRSFELLNKVLPEFHSEWTLVEGASQSLRQVLDSVKFNPHRLLESNILLAKNVYQYCFDQIIPDQALLESVEKIQLLGRFQILQDLNPLVVVDVAHNPQATENLKRQLKNLMTSQKASHVTAIVGMMADKEIKQVLEILQPLVNDWCFVDLDIDRAISAEDLRKVYLSLDLSEKSNSTIFDSVKTAFQWCIQQEPTQKNDDKQLVIVFGSFITVADMLKVSLEIDFTKN